jgi:methyl acetate hydrolase
MTAWMELDRALQTAVAGGVPGVVAMAADADGPIYQAAHGVRDVTTGAEMTLDTVGWIASMTKPVTSVAAMQLVEQGRLELDAPLAPLLPVLAATQVLDGFGDDGTPKLRPPRRPITLRHLLTHTAGFGYDMWSEDLVRYQHHAGLPRVGGGQKAALGAPLLFDPGERWVYSISTDFVGQAVEAASGQLLDDYVRDHITGPLGMTDTVFRLGASQRARLASVHARAAEGGFSVLPFEVVQEPEFRSGGGGLYGTVPDYIRFARMVLNQGTLEGTRVLSPPAIAEMARNQIGDLHVTTLRTAIPALTNDANFYPDMVQHWGLGFLINTERDAHGRSAGSLAWGGLANTYFWIDPIAQVSGVVMMQLLPFADPAALECLWALERGVYGRG